MKTQSEHEVTYVGDEEYHGHDGDRRVDLYPDGESKTVSAEKAAQLARDFPHLFLIDGEHPDGFVPPPPAEHHDDEDNLVPFGSDAFWAKWDDESEEELVDAIAEWAAEGAGPTAEELSELADHEAAHGNRAAVLAALEDAQNAGPPASEPPVEIAEPVDLSKFTKLAELVAYAEKVGVDAFTLAALGKPGASKKQAVEAIEKHLAAQSG